MPVLICKVSYRDRDQTRDVEVPAETVNEAVILAIKAFRQGRKGREPPRHAKLTIEVKYSRTYVRTPHAAIEWLFGSRGRTADEKERKKRLRQMLADDRR